MLAFLLSSLHIRFKDLEDAGGRLFVFQPREELVDNRSDLANLAQDMWFNSGK